jgi:hypothetical protein
MDRDQRRRHWRLGIAGMSAVISIVAIVLSLQSSPPPPLKWYELQRFRPLIEGYELPAPYRLEYAPAFERVEPIGHPSIPVAGDYYVIHRGSDEQMAGYVFVVSYGDIPTTDMEYTGMIIHEITHPIPLFVGETGAQSTWSVTENATYLVFRRCNILVLFALRGNVSYVLTPMAHVVDQRIQATMCPK